MMPQLLQQGRLLSLSCIGLYAEIQHIHETNPLLEIEEETNTGEGIGQAGRNDEGCQGDDDIVQFLDLPAKAIEDEGHIAIPHRELDQNELHEQPMWDSRLNPMPIDRRRPNDTLNTGICGLPVNLSEVLSEPRDASSNQAIFRFK